MVTASGTFLRLSRGLRLSPSVGPSSGVCSCSMQPRRVCGSGAEGAGASVRGGARLREIPSADAQLVGAGAEAVLQVRGPWDDHRAFELRAAPGGLAEAVAASGRGHAGGSGAVLAMPRLVHPCRVGCADRIAAFYSEAPLGRGAGALSGLRSNALRFWSPCTCVGG